MKTLHHRTVEKQQVPNKKIEPINNPITYITIFVSIFIFIILHIHVMNPNANIQKAFRVP